MVTRASNRLAADGHEQRLTQKVKRANLSWKRLCTTESNAI